jgi:hypothetical protein
MAHDLNNLTTPISTLLQLLESGSITDMMRDELLPVSNRNMKKMCAYIQESLFFTKNLRLDLKPLRLDQLVETVIADAMAGKRKDKPMRYEKQLSGEVLATLDAVLIQRLLSNLIANAIDASEDDSVIRVTLHSPRFENHREWVRIEVMDQGTGISHVFLYQKNRRRRAWLRSRSCHLPQNRSHARRHTRHHQRTRKRHHRRSRHPLPSGRRPEYPHHHRAFSIQDRVTTPNAHLTRPHLPAGIWRGSCRCAGAFALESACEGGRIPGHLAIRATGD